MKCSLHLSYRPVMAPSNACPECWRMWQLANPLRTPLPAKCLTPPGREKRARKTILPRRRA